MNIGVKITRIVYFAKFEPGASKPPVLTELLFGRPGEAFVAHLVTAAPDFDQIVEVALSQVPPGGAGGFKTIASVDGHDDTQPLGPQDRSFQIPVYGRRAPVTVFLLRQLYFETGDLSSAMMSM